MADKQWTTNCILAGIEVGRLLDLGEFDKVRDYLKNLTSELTPNEIEYLITRAYAVQTKKGGGNNGI